jgi:hypothetical protein
MGFNLAALLLSILAVSTSTWFAIRQANLMRHANHIPAVIELLSAFRSPLFNDHFDYVCNKLGLEHDPALGVSSLPADAKAAFYDVTYFFQHFAVLSTLDIVDQRSVILIHQHRILSVWRSVKPFVEREREINSAAGPFYCRLIEELAIKAEQISPQEIDEFFMRQR